MPARLEIVLFGPFDLKLNGETINLASRQLQKLIAYLALHAGQKVPRATLAGKLWLDSPERTARKNLRQYLWHLRQVIGDEYLLTTRDTAAFNAAADYRLDVEVLQRSPVDGDLKALIEAVSVYRGELLPGFYDDWLILERERLQAIFERRMQTLLDRLAAEARWPDLIAWAEHWIANAQTPEPAYRALMIGNAGLGDLAGVAKNYRRCQTALEEAVGVEPSAETRALYERLTSEERPDAGGPIDYSPEVITPARLPDFLRKGAEPERPIFVGRQSELERLNRYLEAVLDGQGQVAFLAGGAGSGKTSMMSAFAARASDSYPDLLVAWGTCNAFGGPGDPFLPIRKALTMLSGDVEEAWSAGAITSGQARRLWQMMPVTTKTLLDYSPDLPETFIPAAPLLNRLELAFPAGLPVLRQLKDRATEQSPASTKERPQLFEQVATLLRRLAEQRPLMLLLDDLQWADKGSIELLFYLARSLSGARILLLGAYRPDEVTAARDHSLRPVLAELRRSFGDVWLNLNQSPGRSFVDAYIDSEANHLDEAFREAFFQKTAGHPLFSVELLRDMQERGDLIKDESGAWSARPALVWDKLPARVEGAVESRLGRLNQGLHDILTMAAVEGEVFTAQVLAWAQELEERSLLRMLSKELGQRHKLVQEERTEQIDRQAISRYRFAHQMFQQYLYNGLPEAERRLLHGQVGEALETLYDDQSDALIVQLARHFDEAGERNKAATYLLAAGDRARSLYANEEAIEHYQRAVEHLRDLGDEERLARTWMRLGQTYHNAFDYQRSRQAYDRGFAIQNYAGGASAEHYARTILRLWLDGPETLAPPFGDDIATEQWHDQLFSGLVEDSDQMVVVPDIARRWSISDGGQTYTFFLRDDARWSDGHPVSAGDFILAWQQMLDPQTPDRLAERLFDIKGARAFHSGRVSEKEHLGLRAPDDQTLIVQLERPASYFLQLLTVAFARPVPQHKLAEHSDNWADPARIVTNGPYLIADWSPEGMVILSRNPHYHGAYGGNVNRAEVKLVDLNNSWQQAVDAFGRRQIDILNATNFPQDAFELAKTSYGQDCVSFPAQSVTGVSFNLYRSPLDDGRVRRAFAMAIDKDEYVQKLLPGQAAPALGGWIPQGLPGHSPDIGLSYDPDFARHLMHEAGYPAGQGFPSLDMLWPDTSSNREQSVYLSQVWQEQLGVNVQANFVSFRGFIQRMRHDIPPIYMRGWGGDFPDPDNFLGAGLHAVTRTSDAQETIDTARRTTDQNERLNLYRRADNSVIDEALVIPLAYNLRHYFVDSRVRVRRFRKTLRWRDIVAGPD